MKKGNFLIVLLIIYSISITGIFGFYISSFSNKPLRTITKNRVITKYVYKKSNNKDTTKNNPSDNDIETSVKPISSSDISNLASKDWTVTENYSTDIDNDGKKEEIKLQVAAGKDENGKIAWNDGQKWALNVYKDNKVYTLFEKFLQMGEYHIIVGTNLDDNSIEIGLLNVNQCGLSLQAFKYNKTNDNFLTLTKSSSLDFNQTLYSGVPYMQ